MMATTTINSIAVNPLAKRMAKNGRGVRVRNDMFKS